MSRIDEIELAVAEWFKRDFVSALNPRLSKLVKRLSQLKDGGVGDDEFARRGRCGADVFTSIDKSVLHVDTGRIECATAPTETSARCGDVLTIVKGIVSKHGNCNPVAGGLTCKVRILAALEKEIAPAPATPVAQLEADPVFKRDFDHFSIVPFKAICGADVPNQSTTQIPERVKCQTCWFYWKEFASSYFVKQSAVTPTTAAVEAAKQIERRWFENDLPEKARVQSTTRRMLRELALDVLSRYLPSERGRDSFGEKS